jgi:RNA polymerase sigma factor (sigma-70 family)
MTESLYPHYFNEIAKEEYDPIKDNADVISLIEIAQEGYDYDTKTWKTQKAIDAKDRVIKANARLAPFIVHKIINAYHPLFMDCVSECNFVILKCILGYDRSKETHFATYYQVSIRRHLWRFLREQANTVKLPSSQVAKRQKVENEIYSSEDCLDKLLKGDFEPVSHVMSLDYDFDNGKSIMNSPHKDIPCHDTASSLIVNDELREATMNSLSCLTVREKDVIEKRYLGPEKMTLKDVASTIGVTGEMVRQIEKAAKNKMRKYVEEDRQEELS